jgi:hypothetical protein
MREVVKKEVLKLLKTGVIYPISDSEWVSPVQVVLNKGGMIVIYNEKNEFIPQRNVTGWWMCIDYQKLNKATQKDHFPLPFIDEMLERLTNCHTPVLGNRTEASIRVPRMFKSHVRPTIW